MLRRKKVMLVDPSPIFRLNLKEAIQTNETLVDVLEADNVDQANDILRNQQPEVVFLDIALPEATGIELIASIKALAADTRIVVVTSQDSDECRTRALQNGADYFLAKEYAIGLHLIDVIHDVIRR